MTGRRRPSRPRTGAPRPHPPSRSGADGRIDRASPRPPPARLQALRSTGRRRSLGPPPPRDRGPDERTRSCADIDEDRLGVVVDRGCAEIEQPQGGWLDDRSPPPVIAPTRSGRTEPGSRSGPDGRVSPQSPLRVGHTSSDGAANHRRPPGGRPEPHGPKSRGASLRPDGRSAHQMGMRPGPTLLRPGLLLSGPTAARVGRCKAPSPGWL